MAADKKDAHLDELGDIIAQTMQKTIEARSSLTFTAKPTIEKKNISEYEGKMRVGGMDVFNSPTYISLTSLYPSEKDMAAHNASGAMVLYLRQEGGEAILRSLGYRDCMEEEFQSMMNGCGSFFEEFLKNFIKEVSGNGYGTLMNSSIENHRNVVSFLIDFCQKEFQKVEVGFSLKNAKAIVVDLTLRPKS